MRSEVLLPRDAPECYRDRGELWNAVEESERRSDSQLAREYELALPRELDHDEQWELVRGWAERELVSRGMCADVCMHDRGDGNSHAFVMCTTRECGSDGFGLKNREWIRKALLLNLRKTWERDQNAALERAYAQLKQDGHSNNLPAEASYGFGRMCELMGFPEVWEFDRRWARDEPKQAAE